MYKRSKYNFSKEYGDELLLYNLVSNNVALLEGEHLKTFQTIGTLEKNTNEEICKELLEAGFIVEASKNETAFVNSRRHSVLYGLFHQKLFTILPTTDCNARCYYCYQEGWKPEIMSEETANATIDFISKNVDDEDEITLNWFGGEPLYNLPIVRKINSAIKEMYGDRYSTLMTSNGSLITPELAKEMKTEWNLKSIQITVDNLFEKYDSAKNYVDGKGFNDAINAIRYCLDNGIRVKVRINIDKNNVDDLETIYAYISNKFGNSPYLSLYAACLTAECKDCHSHAYYQESEYREILNKFLDIRFKYDNDKKIYKYIYPLIYTTCSAKTNYAFVISPTGLVYKCQHLHDEDCVGNVKDGVVFNDAMTYFLNPNIDEKCEKCKFMPACHGGCPNSAKHGMAVGGMCRDIKYDIQKKLLARNRCQENRFS